MEEALLKTIAGIIEDKKARNIVPCHALSTEVHKAVNDALNNLYKQGKIDAGDTLNHKWITLNEL
jgi:hypothetical protein